MATTTYSFSDVSLVLSHPSVGKCTITGEGVGSVTVSRANDNTQHDVAADGSVMVSKIHTKNGTIAIAIQRARVAEKADVLPAHCAHVRMGEGQRGAEEPLAG